MDSKVIAVDFDGTLCKWDSYPNVGEDVPNAWETVKRLIASGHRIIIWTVRDIPKPVLDRLHVHGLRGHESVTFNFRPNQYTYSKSPKVDADLYIDDKALGVPLDKDTLGRHYVDWFHVEQMLITQGYFDNIILGG